MAEIVQSEQLNKVMSVISQNDDMFDSLVQKVQSVTDVICEEVSDKVKYDAILSIEYLLVKLRLNTEFEHLKVKSILSRTDIQPVVKSQFIKRDQYLAQVSLKLNTIRDDIANLQKIVYTSQLNQFK